MIPRVGPGDVRLFFCRENNHLNGTMVHKAAFFFCFGYLSLKLRAQKNLKMDDRKIDLFPFGAWPTKVCLKMIFLFPRWDMLVS